MAAKDPPNRFLAGPVFVPPGTGVKSTTDVPSQNIGVLIKFFNVTPQEVFP